MEATEIRQRRRAIKHTAIILVALILMPLNQGCDIAKVMAAIGQLVQAIMPNTGAAGASGTAGSVTCSTSSCDADSKPAAKKCRKTVDCGAWCGTQNDSHNDC